MILPITNTIIEVIIVEMIDLKNGRVYKLNNAKFQDLCTFLFDLMVSCMLIFLLRPQLSELDLFSFKWENQPLFYLMGHSCLPHLTHNLKYLCPSLVCLFVFL